MPARTGGLLLMSCRCMKTTTQSGQAWRGYERAQRGLSSAFGGIQVMSRAYRFDSASRVENEKIGPYLVINVIAII